uniref:Dipeptidyl peptidase 3 n=1 Tax=Plectus sambesii TaxID=2011161 RepID=A0A914VSE5_9BILA
MRRGFRVFKSSLIAAKNCKSPTLLSPLIRYSSQATPQLKVSSTMPEGFNRDFYILPNNTPVCNLDCKDAFTGLTDKEKRYAHYLSRASWNGSLIVYLQTSPESPAIFALLHKLLSAEPIESLKKKAIEECKWKEDDFTALLVYAAGFFANSGNYKGFGDTKFVPNLDAAALGCLVEKSAAAEKDKSLIELFNSTKERMFSLNPNELNLALAPTGVTTYHSSSVTKSDSDLIDRFMKAKNLEGWNTRLFKTTENGHAHYHIRLGSIDDGVVSTEEFEGATVSIVRGDYSQLLNRTNEDLTKALEFVANDNQKEMIHKYIEHFRAGDINAHKDGSRFWIRDVGPAVESYIGFIENYRDPVGVRSEFEGFVAAVNKETSKIFAALVDNAEMLLERLPWGKTYEKDAFLKPDFTALDVISFGGSGIPAGINIPNYDEIRQNEGFKNVSLGNVISALPKLKINFLKPEDEELFRELHKESFEVQVGLHELLGHGSGKLFQRNKDGSFNFDKSTVKDLITGEPIASWYEDGETWSTKFGALASAYEECRAEAVGYFLCCFTDVLKIFGFEGERGQLVKYVNWLSEVRAGLMGLEFFSADAKKWGQAHCYARYVLLRVCLEAEQGFVEIEETTGEDGKPDLLFKLDRSKIDSVGKPAVFEFLKKLQAYKATGDVENGTKLFESYGSVGERELKWRQIVIARRQPRRLFVQANTVLESNGSVNLKVYPETIEGVLQSMIERYEPEAVADIIALWQKDRKHFDI